MAFTKLAAAQEERARQRAAAGRGGNLFLVPDGGEETIRILEDAEEMETNSAYFHELDAIKGKVPRLEICLDQDEEGNRVGVDCPGCELNAEDWETAKRKFVMFANVIHRDAPVRKKEGDKWVETDENKDQLAVWEIRQVTVQDALSQALITYKSLTNRDFVVRRRGTGFDTTYSLQPATNDEGDAIKTPLTAADKELAEKKQDLSTRIAKVTYDDWGKVTSRKKDGPKDEDAEEKDSPFLKRGQKKEDE